MIFFFNFNAYLFLREREEDTESKSKGGSRQWATNTESDVGPELNEPWDHDLSRSRTPSWLSHLGAPDLWLFGLSSSLLLFLRQWEIIKEEQIQSWEKGPPGWLSQLSIRLLVLAQVVISPFRGFKPLIGLCADRAEPAWDSISSSLSTPPLLACSLSQNK